MLGHRRAKCTILEKNSSCQLFHNLALHPGCHLKISADMGPRRRKALMGALVLLACSCRALSFLLPGATSPQTVGSSFGASTEPSLTRQQQQRRPHHRQARLANGAALRNREEELSPTARSAGLPLLPRPTRGSDSALSTTSSSSSASAAAAGVVSDDEGTALSLDKALEEGINRAMRGDPGVLRQVLAEGVEWRGPLGQKVGLAAVEEELRGLGQLLTEPRMSVIASAKGAKKLDWVGSGTWPLPWLPRYIVRGESVIETGAGGKVGRWALLCLAALGCSWAINSQTALRLPVGSAMLAHHPTQHIIYL